MLDLVSPVNSLLVKYKASMDSTPTCVIPKKVTLNTIEGTSTYLQVEKKKSKAKPKVVEKEASEKNVPKKCGKGVSKKVTE